MSPTAHINRLPTAKRLEHTDNLLFVFLGASAAQAANLKRSMGRRYDKLGSQTPYHRAYARSSLLLLKRKNPAFIDCRDFHWFRSQHDGLSDK